MSEKQKELQVNALQLLAHQAPLSSIMLYCIIPFVEDLFGEFTLFDPVRDLYEWSFIILSCLSAFFVSISTYWVIGTTTAFTYTMLSNIKFIVIIIIGYMVFEEPISGAEQIDANIAVCVGLMLYTYLKNKDAVAEKKLSSSTSQFLLGVVPTQAHELYESVL
jgi:drug/metabolite transporter (DMT)-like permease